MPNLTLQQILDQKSHLELVELLQKQNGYQSVDIRTTSVEEQNNKFYMVTMIVYKWPRLPTWVHIPKPALQQIAAV